MRQLSGQIQQFYWWNPLTLYQCAIFEPFLWSEIFSFTEFVSFQPLFSAFCLSNFSFFSGHTWHIISFYIWVPSSAVTSRPPAQPWPALWYHMSLSCPYDEELRGLGSFLSPSFIHGITMFHGPLVCGGASSGAQKAFRNLRTHQASPCIWADEKTVTLS